ncbi:hypothetical protein PR003_g21654 [Phytophthora rubi]|uniref:Uncharacterized protein n=1 Tax=Phytophthora rubi TaxID=129364 RepID=A0A6A3NFA4_9STRA|nr:hypothetical protein PR002_g4785 [Phytophthora rubi]KAE9304831.1 hypothetical protein PR003_g21654 [Phytophthora rubi]
MASVEYDVESDADTYSFAAVMLACSSEEVAIAWAMNAGPLALQPHHLPHRANDPHSELLRSLQYPDVEANQYPLLLGLRGPRDGGRAARAA